MVFSSISKNINLPSSNFLTNNKHFYRNQKREENLIDWFSIGHNFLFVSRLLQKTKNRKKNRYELEIDLGPERVETNRQNLEQQKYGISKQNRKNFQITCFVVVILSSSLFHFLLACLLARYIYFSENNNNIDDIDDDDDKSKSINFQLCSDDVHLFCFTYQN